MTSKKFSGLWYCRYWYPSNDHPGEDVSEYCIRIEPSKGGRQFVLHSVPNTIESEDSYMLARFSVDDQTVTGSWMENTSPTGSFKGAMYSGVFQLLFNDAGTKMEGKWAGIGRTNIFTGRWEIVRVPEEEATALMEKSNSKVRPHAG